MAEITSKDVVVGVKKGVTWNTEIVVTSGVFLYCSSIKVSGGFDTFEARDVGTSGFKTTQARLGSNFTVEYTCDLTYGQGWLFLLAMLMGTESSPSETTVGQGDYLDNIDFAASNDGLFFSSCHSIESARVMVLPSVKIMSAKASIRVNQAGQVVFKGIADRFMVSSTSTVSNISGLTKYTYATATMGGTNHYFRMNSDSGAGLSSGDNLDVQGIDWEFTRNLQPRWGFRGANTPYTKEPYQTGLIQGSLKVYFSTMDSAVKDVFGDYSNASTMKAEYYTDGAQIGSGVNRSIKPQFPYLQPPGAIPEGFDFGSNSQLLLPSLSYTTMQRSAAPTGMTGVTNYMRMAVVQERSTKWTA